MTASASRDPMISFSIVSLSTSFMLAARPVISGRLPTCDVVTIPLDSAPRNSRAMPSARPGRPSAGPGRRRARLYWTAGSAVCGRASARPTGRSGPRR